MEQQESKNEDRNGEAGLAFIYLGDVHGVNV